MNHVNKYCIEERETSSKFDPKIIVLCFKYPFIEINGDDAIFEISDVDLQNQIDASLAMPATYQTLIARAQLAQQCCGLAREQTRICERLVHDQHLQQQGWAAVVANLEDITQMFQSRADLLQQSFAVYLSERQRHMELLEK